MKLIKADIEVSGKIRLLYQPLHGPAIERQVDTPLLYSVIDAPPDTFAIMALAVHIDLLNQRIDELEQRIPFVEE